MRIEFDSSDGLYIWLHLNKKVTLGLQLFSHDYKLGFHLQTEQDTCMVCFWPWCYVGFKESKKLNKFEQGLGLLMKLSPDLVCPQCGKPMDTARGLVCIDCVLDIANKEKG